MALGMFLIGSFLVSLICFVCITGYAKAETHYVNPGESIQTAIDNAQSGDTVIVNSGTYFENITITKQIKLEGESASATIINGGGVAFGIQIVIAAGMNNLILSPENSYPNIIGVLFGMFMQFLGLTLILNKLSLEHENILRELKLTKKLIKDE